MHRPEFSITEPAAISDPWGRIHAPDPGNCLTRTVPSLLNSRSSIITTASAHTGIGAPVIIRAASPSIPFAASTESPARSSPANDIGLPPRACVRPVADNTTPSRAELLNGGIDRFATAGSAKTHPTVSSSGTCDAGTRRLEARSLI
ncbi:MAG: Uncharacterised protein [Gammaproteobacteria bacterium]|nr:MAG: Uncharacterised protein [Gammaproteobacteria bacterium]